VSRTGDELEILAITCTIGIPVLKPPGTSNVSILSAPVTITLEMTLTVGMTNLCNSPFSKISFQLSLVTIQWWMRGLYLVSTHISRKLF